MSSCHVLLLKILHTQDRTRFIFGQLQFTSWLPYGGFISSMSWMSAPKPIEHLWPAQADYWLIFCSRLVEDGRWPGCVSLARQMFPFLLFASKQEGCEHHRRRPLFKQMILYLNQAKTHTEPWLGHPNAHLLFTFE